MFLGDAGAVVLDQEFDEPGLRADRHEHAAAAIFRGVLDQIAQHLIEVLPLDMHRQIVRAVDVDADMAVQRPDRAFDRFQARPDLRPAVRRPAPADRAGAGEVMIDLAAHRARLADHRLAEIVGIGGRGVHHDGQRRLQRMREVACVQPRLLRLAFVVRDQRVQFLDHRRQFDRQRTRHAVRLARTHPRDLLAHPAQRPQPVEGLERGQHDQPEREQRETAHQCPPQHRDLRVQAIARLRDLKPPLQLRSRQRHVLFDDAKLLILELHTLVGMGGAVVVIAAVSEPPIP